MALAKGWKNLKRDASTELWLVRVGVNLVISFGLFVATDLRETPSFWLNAGGWPVWFRDLIHYGFYPVLFVYAVLTVRSIAAAAQLPANRWIRLLCWLQCLLLLGVVIFFSWNNLVNFIEGDPLHQHVR